MKFYAFNVKLQSEKRKGYPAYLNLFEEAHKIKDRVDIGRHTQAVMRELFHSTIPTDSFSSEFIKNNEENQFVYGTIIKFTNIEDSDWYNIQTDEIDSNFNVPAGVFPNPQDMSYYFFPQIHTMFVEKKISDKTIQRFLQSHFGKVVGDDENLNIHVEANIQIIDAILYCQSLHNLELQLTPTNDDLLAEQYQELLDKGLKDSKTRSMIVILKDSFEKKGLVISDMIKAFLKLVERNGRAKANIVDKYGVRKTIETSQYPHIMNAPREKDKKSMGVGLFENYMRQRKENSDDKTN